MKIKLNNNKCISEDDKPFLVAEIGQAHDGSLGIAHSFIDAVADAGADAIKFQTHFADYESSNQENFRVNFSYSDKTRYDYWKRIEFNLDEWVGLYEHAIKKNLTFISSPFSIYAVSLLDSIGQEIWKIGSGEIFNNDLIDSISKTGKPLIVSTGLCNEEDFSERIAYISSKVPNLIILECTSEYPSDINDLFINNIVNISQNYNLLAGFSDHSGSIYPALYASSLKQTSLIEVHVTFDKNMFGPDSSSSLDLDQLSELSKAINDFHILRKQTNKKFSKNLDKYKKLFSRSYGVVRNLKSGHIIVEEDLILRKPSGGICQDDKLSLVGKRLRVNKSFKDLLAWDDFE
jgi:N,N'-diacetyllegionaminate synthase